MHIDFVIPPWVLWGAGAVAALITIGLAAIGAWVMYIFPDGFRLR